MAAYYVCITAYESKISWLSLVCLQAEAQQADSVDIINEWAARVTKGLIKMAVPPGTPFDMVLTNAVYFKVKHSSCLPCPPAMGYGWCCANRGPLACALAIYPAVAVRLLLLLAAVLLSQQGSFS